MILAIIALLWQFQAIPQSSLSTTAFLNPGGASAASQPADALTTDGNASPAPSEAASDAVGPSDSTPQPAGAVAFQPGRLVPEPVVPATPAAAIKVTALPAYPGAAAFFGSTAAGLRAKREEQRQRHIWLALSIAQSGAATIDAWSTRHLISNGGQELNPMLRPFAGNASLYAAIQVAPLLLDYAGHRMLTSEHGWARHTWWMPQAVGTAMSVASGAHNLSR